MPWRTILRMRAGGRYGTVGNRNKMKQEWLNMVERFHHVYIMFIMCFCPKVRYYRSQMGIFNADWIHISNPFQLGYHISDKAISISCLCNRIYPQVGMGLSLVQLHPKGGFGVEGFFSWKQWVFCRRCWIEEPIYLWENRLFYDRFYLL